MGEEEDMPNRSDGEKFGISSGSLGDTSRRGACVPRGTSNDVGRQRQTLEGNEGRSLNVLNGEIRICKEIQQSLRQGIGRIGSPRGGQSHEVSSGDCGIRAAGL